MPLAARAGDMTSHGTPLNPALGSANVWVGGQRAWRAFSDVHVCPLSDGGPKPHVGGAVLNGSTKVFINNLPTARQGDVIVESGPPNSIAAGCQKVQFGG
jgi:uncharacterized Zn-binding protein involved in type VI secretion